MVTTYGQRMLHQSQSKTFFNRFFFVGNRSQETKFRPVTGPTRVLCFPRKLSLKDRGPQVGKLTKHCTNHKKGKLVAWCLRGGGGNRTHSHPLTHSDLIDFHSNRKNIAASYHSDRCPISGLDCEEHNLVLGEHHFIY